MNLHDYFQSAEADRPHLLLLGDPVSHSLSPLMHNTAAAHHELDLKYHAVKLEVHELGLLNTHMYREQFRGANVTIPYKEVLADHVDKLDEEAEEIGAVNTIAKEKGQLIGYNTDSYGFRIPLKDLEDRLVSGRAIVFGTGGASRAVVHALDRIGLSEIILISRTPGNQTGYDQYDQVRIEGYDAWSVFAEEASIIVNSTPLGMEGRVDSSPVRESERDHLAGKICYDLVYNPMKTKFLRWAEEAGAEIVGGLDMLIYQGSRSFEIWTGNSFPVEIIRNHLHEYLTNRG